MEDKSQYMKNTVPLIDPESTLKDLNDNWINKEVPMQNLGKAKGEIKLGMRITFNMDLHTLDPNIYSATVEVISIIPPKVKFLSFAINPKP